MIIFQRDQECQYFKGKCYSNCKYAKHANQETITCSYEREENDLKLLLDNLLKILENYSKPQGMRIAEVIIEIKKRKGESNESIKRLANS